MRCHRNVRRGGGAIVIFVLLMPTPRSGGPAGGPDSDLGGRWPPRAPPLAPPLVPTDMNDSIESQSCLLFKSEVLCG